MISTITMLREEIAGLSRDIEATRPGTSEWREMLMQRAILQSQLNSRVDRAMELIKGAAA